MNTQDELAVLYYPKNPVLRTVFGMGFNVGQFDKNPYRSDRKQKLSQRERRALNAAIDAWDLGKTCGIAAREKFVLEPTAEAVEEFRQKIEQKKKSCLSVNGSAGSSDG